MTCFFFSSFKTLLTLTEGIPRVRVNVPTTFSLAGFQVTTIGRFWVTAEECGLGIEIPIQLNGLLVPFLELSAELKDFSKLTFSDCLFSNLAIDHGVESASLPKFLSCYIDELEGRSSTNDLPTGVFDKDCEFGPFSSTPPKQRPQSSQWTYLRVLGFS